MSDLQDIDSLLADILDDSKPLPTAPTVVAQVVNVQANSKGGMGELMVSDPETLLEGIMAGDEPAPSPMDVAAKTEVDGEMALADALGDSHTSVDLPNQDLTTQQEHASIFTDSEVRDGSAKSTPIKMPTFTPEDFASTIDIRNFATLVTLNTARWHAKVKDRQAGRDAAGVSEADERAFEVRKNLLVGADTKLRAIHKAIDEARAAHYDLTLPWTTTSMTDVGRRTGGRLLPNTLFVEYTTVMADKKQQMVAALDSFLPDYPALIEAAKKKLGKRFDAREYPNPSSIRQHFDLSFDFQPIPKGDDFKGLPQAQLDALARKVNANTRQMAENAMADVWVRLRDVVEKMAERLSDPNKLFHDTLVGNVRDAARLVAHLNITNDAKVESIRAKVEKHLCQHDAKDLRKNPVLRQQVGAQAVSILQEMDK